MDFRILLFLVLAAAAGLAAVLVIALTRKVWGAHAGKLRIEAAIGGVASLLIGVVVAMTTLPWQQACIAIGIAALIGAGLTHIWARTARWSDGDAWAAFLCLVVKAALALGGVVAIATGTVFLLAVR